MPWGFRHTCYIATAAKNLKDPRNSSFIDTSYGIRKEAEIKVLIYF